MIPGAELVPECATSQNRIYSLQFSAVSHIQNFGDVVNLREDGVSPTGRALYIKGKNEMRHLPVDPRVQDIFQPYILKEFSYGDAFPGDTAPLHEICLEVPDFY